MATDKTFEVLEVGVFALMNGRRDLRPGEVGYVVANIKKTSDVKIGDTITTVKHPAETLTGFRLIAPVVYAGIYPVDSADFEAVRDALVNCQLNDSALYVEQESRLSAGFGFRADSSDFSTGDCLLSACKESSTSTSSRLRPSVVYKFTLSDGKELNIDNVATIPTRRISEYVESPG